VPVAPVATDALSLLFDAASVVPTAVGSDDTSSTEAAQTTQTSHLANTGGGSSASLIGAALVATLLGTALVCISRRRRIG